MFDLSKEFKKFYDTKVKLPQNDISSLREKKRINIERLEDGLEEYNNENKTEYKIVEKIEQGSVAMATVIQNDSNDYDIDVAIVFDEENIKSIGAIAMKNIVVDALKRKCTNFKKEPEAKTNCVRIEYSDNYHIDFAIYRRIKINSDEYKYEHAGSEWRERNPRAINNWFKEEINSKGDKLRNTIRLSKAFCKSRISWNMPGGLIQTVLCSEQVENKDRLDEIFYNCIIKIKNRLQYNKEVYNPTNNQSLIMTEEHKDKMNNLYNRLCTYIEKLSILFDEECTRQKACDAWYDFFNNDFWISEVNENMENHSVCEDNEEYIDNLFPLQNNYKLIKLDCRLTDSNQKMPDRLLSKILLNNEKIKIGYSLDFYIENVNVSRPYEVYWKIKNNGEEAIRLNDLRGEIIKSRETNEHQHVEYAKFKGNHYVECYIIKNNVCVAIGRINVPIG